MKKLSILSSAAVIIFSTLLFSCENEKKETTNGSTKKKEQLEERYWSNTIEKLEFIEVESKSTGQKYVVGIGLPKNYDSKKDKKYPAIYQLDGEGAFHTSVETTRGLAKAGDLEEVIVVGIYNYGAKSRWLDLTPSQISTPITEIASGHVYDSPVGGSDKFFNFLVDELMPKINADYSTDKVTNVLFGHSLGGLFSLSALKKKESPFSHYLISSPSIWWNDREIFKTAVSDRDFTPIVYLNVGEFEQIPSNMPEDMLKIIPKETIESDKTARMVEGMIEAFEYLKKQENVEVYGNIEESEGHLSSNVPGFSKGIRVLLNGINRDELRRRYAEKPKLPWVAE